LNGSENFKRGLKNQGKENSFSSGFGYSIIVIHKLGLLGITAVDLGFAIIPGGAMSPAAATGWPFLVLAELQGK
jgi:hypothetical protein